MNNINDLVWVYLFLSTFTFFLLDIINIVEDTKNQLKMPVLELHMIGLYQCYYLFGQVPITVI